MGIDDITGDIIDASMLVHSELGPGLLESAYQVCLAAELRYRGRTVTSQVPIKVQFRGGLVDCAYRLDLVVEGSVIVEVKAVARLLPVHEAQLLSYLRLTDLKVGLLINFHEAHLRDGIRRMINEFNRRRSSATSASSAVKPPRPP